MTQQIADYFKTQPVVKAWLFGSSHMMGELERCTGRRVDMID
ncbi:MAG: nucleotidyltransferase domain-containing protein [Prevotella sp.]|nr:nucleotidyltransferase domain-containing protein [Prevotella sp.]